MSMPPSLWDAARREMEEYHLTADPHVQPRWEIPEAMVIHTAVSGRLGAGESDAFPTSLDSFLEAAGEVIEHGATAVHIDYSWIVDGEGRRLDRDLRPVEAYRAVIEPLRERFGMSFVTDCNALNGTTFDECMAPVREGLAETAPCAPGHPEDFMVPAYQAIQEAGARPVIAIHSSGEIELCKRKLIDTGILKPPYHWGLLFGLPFDSGRTLLSGTWTPNTRDLAMHLIMMVDQIRTIDPDPVIIVCAAGRAGLFTTTLATMMGLHIRVGTEDTIWKYPHRDELVSSNVEMLEMAKEIAALHGRRPATANEYRAMIGLPTFAAV